MLVHVMVAFNHSCQYPGVEAVTFFTVLYMGLCAYRVIFRIRIFNWYFMVPQHQTDAFRPALCHTPHTTDTTHH